jgi:hypothetical protein
MGTQDTPAPNRTDRPADRRAPDAGGLPEWKELLRSEEARCAEFGIGAAIFSLGVSGAVGPSPTDGEVVAEIAGRLRPTDRVCLLRAGEYGILVIPLPDRRAAEHLAVELFRGLKGRGWEVHLGWAMRRDGHGLFHAAAQADAAMLRSGTGRIDLTDPIDLTGGD